MLAWETLHGAIWQTFLHFSSPTSFSTDKEQPSIPSSHLVRKSPSRHSVKPMWSQLALLFWKYMQICFNSFLEIFRQSVKLPLPQSRDVVPLALAVRDMPGAACFVFGRVGQGREECWHGCWVREGGVDPNLGRNMRWRRETERDRSIILWHRKPLQSCNTEHWSSGKLG